MPTELERELLPCPFCGTAEPQVVEQYAGTKQSQWSVICNGHWCDASVSSDGSGSLESAIETWNRRTDAAALQVQQPGAQAVCNVDGSWLWLKLMDWCKKQRIAPATQNALFEIAGEAHKLYTQPPSIPEPSEDDVDVACEALDFDNDVFAHMRERVQGVLTTYTARLRERIGGGA